MSKRLWPKVDIKRIRIQRCSICGAQAVVTGHVRYTIFRGDDDHFAACAEHLPELRDTPQAFAERAYAERAKRKEKP